MIVTPDRNGNLDGSVVRIAQNIDSFGLPILPLTRIDGFKFNEGLLPIKDYILLDYCELWWNTDNVDTHIFGKNTNQFSEIFSGDEWQKFDDWVANNPPKVYLKRELFKKDVTDEIIPADYMGWFDMYDVQDRDKFNSRPINCFFYWGRSSEYRVNLHAEIWKNSGKVGAAICDNLFYLEYFLKEERSTNKWVTVNIPHYARQPIENVLAINMLSKLSVSHNGSGRKCFRSAESPANSVMVTEENDLAWAFDWVDGENCIKFNTGDEIKAIEQALANPNLYDIYVNGVENANKYNHVNYIPYLKKIISERL